MIYRDYEDKDFFPLLDLLNKFWTEVHRENLNRFFETGGLKFNGIEGKLYQFQREGCRIQVAESKGTLVGFHIYHLIFDTICITRGMYFMPDHRNLAGLYGFFRGMIKAGLKRVYSQTYADHQPPGMSKSTKKWEVIQRTGDMLTWEYKI